MFQKFADEDGHTNKEKVLRSVRRFSECNEEENYERVGGLCKEISAFGKFQRERSKVMNRMERKLKEGEREKPKNKGSKEVENPGKMFQDRKALYRIAFVQYQKAETVSRERQCLKFSSIVLYNTISIWTHQPSRVHHFAKHGPNLSKCINCSLRRFFAR